MSIQDEARAEAGARYRVIDGAMFGDSASVAVQRSAFIKGAEWQASRKPGAAPATPVSDTDRGKIERLIAERASILNDHQMSVLADAILDALSRSQPVQVEVTDDMIARAEREYQWSGNIRKVLVAALGGGDHAE